MIPYTEQNPLQNKYNKVKLNQIQYQIISTRSVNVKCFLQLAAQDQASDTIGSLVKRLCIEEGIHDTKQQKLQAKLIQSLNKLVDSQHISNVLKRKVSKFIQSKDKEIQQDQSSTHLQISNKFEQEDKQNQFRKDVVVNDWGTENTIQEFNLNTESKKASTNQKEYDITQFIASHNNQNWDRDSNLDTNLNFTLEKRTYQDFPQTDQMQDQQLINAYKVILRKSKEPELRRIVEQTLRKTRIQKLKTQTSNIQRVMQPPSKQNSRIQTETSSSVRYTYSPLRKSLYVFKGNSSNKFHQYNTNQNRLYNNPCNLQYSIPASQQRRNNGHVGRKYNYLKQQM